MTTPILAQHLSHGAIHPSRARPYSRRHAIAISALHKEWRHTHSGGGAGAAAAAARAPREPLLEPDAATIEMLTVLRDPRNISQLRPFLPEPLEDPPGPVIVAGLPVLEQGPLAGCARFVDAAARRALPGHLLRRARVLSSLRVGGECLQRVALTACSGEELVLTWRLQHVGLQDEGATSSAPEPGSGSGEGAASSSGASGAPAGRLQAGCASAGPSGSGSSSSRSSSSSAAGVGIGGAAAGVEEEACTAWRLLSIKRDASGDDEPPPPRPHPRLPPERVVLAMLAALRRGELHAAARFAVWGRHASSAGWDAQMQEFKALLRQPAYHSLLTHDAAELGAGALPVGQRSFVQEVTLVSRSGGGGGGGGGRARFLFVVNMHADGCWLVRKFEAR